MDSKGECILTSLGIMFRLFRYNLGSILLPGHKNEVCATHLGGRSGIVKESRDRISVTKQALTTCAQVTIKGSSFLLKPFWQSTEPAGWESINLTATKGWHSQGTTNRKPSVDYIDGRTYQSLTPDAVKEHCT